MITCPNPKLMKGYENIGLQQEGTIASRRLRICGIEPLYGSTNIAANMMGSVRALAGLPNQRYIDAIDLNIIKGDNMSMGFRREAQETLDEEEEFTMLSAEVISDLIDEEPDICTINDVKVRFK
jgi:hypothetical protein